MSYPGNPSLAAPVKDRVVSTFRQSLALFKQGRMDEVASGCGLILQMDPQFDPAKKLLEKSRNPSLPIDVDTLLPAGPDAKLTQARQAMAARDFIRVTQLTSEILTEDLLNDEARLLSDEAQEKIEAAPFVEQFTARAAKALDAGNTAAAKLDLEKARALDPTHPDVVSTAMQIAARESAPPRPQPPSPSFVVEDRARPATSGRSTAQASDFGFTFEEERPGQPPAGDFSFDAPASGAAGQSAPSFSFDAPAGGGFSFDSPTPQPSGPHEFDFATASIVTSDDDQRKIEQFLADGDRAFAAGDSQQAIDLWSRIFLIDVTNDQASDRIEKAKARRREIEQKAEAVLASGIEAFDRGDTAKAHAELNEVLRLDPGNTTAQEYLDRLGETVTEGGASAYEIPFVAPQGDDSFGLGALEEDLPSGFEQPLIPPDPGEAAAPPKTAKAKPARAARAASARALPLKAIGGAIAVVVLLAAGWWAWSRLGGAPEAPDTAATEAVLARATSLANRGQHDKAIAILREIQPGNPLHDRALVMIADLQAKKSKAAQLIDGIPFDQYYDQKVAEARAAFDAYDYVGAKNAFDQAVRAKPLPPDLKALYDTAAQQAAKLDSAKALFAERRYQDAIASLQALLEQDPQNQNIRRLMTDAHFNLGATALLEERTQIAVKEFDEVLKADPNDDLARRSRELAIRYDGEPKDLLYKIYVKYLPLRGAG